MSKDTLTAERAYKAKGDEDFLLATQTFEDFCLLRAESVRGQLEGTIPSTILDQQQDKSTFVDAVHIIVGDFVLESGKRVS